MKTIAIAGTFDSKGEEFAYVRDLVHSMGLNTLMIHTGVFEPQFEPDITNAQVAQYAGADIQEIQKKKDRGTATKILSAGMEKLIPELYDQGRFDGILSFGGSGGTALVTPAMRALPIGVPKLMVSTMAGGDVSPYVGASDIIMYPSIVDVAGLNSLSRKIFINAVFAIVGMVSNECHLPCNRKPLIAATMFGVTTPCVDYAREYLEQNGYEVIVFHATGTGGKAMEKLIEAGHFVGVLDLTTTEWCDQLFGGILAAGEHRLEMAGKKGIPQVVSVGALDMVNFGPRNTVPPLMSGRKLYQHNPMVTLIRTTKNENELLGKVIAAKLNQANSPTVLMLPLNGISMLDAPNQAFYGPEEDAVLFDTLRREVDTQKVPIIGIPCHINDKEFGVSAAKKLVELMEH